MINPAGGAAVETRYWTRSVTIGVCTACLLAKTLTYGSSHCEECQANVPPSVQREDHTPERQFTYVWAGTANRTTTTTTSSGNQARYTIVAVEVGIKATWNGEIVTLEVQPQSRIT